MCADYTSGSVKEHEVRSWFDPPLAESDVTKATILLYIEAVNEYISSVYELSTSSNTRIPALLLVVSRLINLPAIAKNHYTLRREAIRNYSYELDVNSSPNVIKITLEDIAERMLRAKSYVKDDKLKIYISNS